MLGSFAVAFRGFLASLLSGAMALFTIYVFFGQGLVAALEPLPHIQQLLDFSRYVPVASLLLVSLLAGSIYTTALEGFIDSKQRRLLHSMPVNHLRPLPRVALRIAPISDSALHRLRREAELFYDLFCPPVPMPTLSKTAFAQAVVEDILWMDGKLVGTPLLNQYNSIRSEGEIKVSSSLLLPVTVAAVARAAGLDTFAVVMVTLGCVPIAIKLLDYGLYYYRRANSLVAHHVADGAVLTPSMESLKRSNPATRPRTQRPGPAMKSSDSEIDQLNVEIPDTILDPTE